jgi:hypothetical protein
MSSIYKTQRSDWDGPKEASTAVSKPITEFDCMKNKSIEEAGFDTPLAHALARITLGLNIAMHGYGRLPNLVGFTNGMVKQFAGTFCRSRTG